jgi:hypothetical protein
MKVSELKALIHDLPDDADINLGGYREPPKWTGASFGVKVLLSTFCVGRCEGDKSCLLVMLDVTREAEEEDPEDQRIREADDLHD